MEKEFLIGLGLSEEACEAVLTEIGRSEDELFAELSKEVRDLRISAAVKAHGVRDEELLRLLIGDCPDIEGAIEKAKKTHGWLFNEDKAPYFSAPTEGRADGLSPFAYGAGIK